MLRMEPNTRIITITGPHGAGKDIIIKKLLTKFRGKLVKSLFLTTRKPRKGEVPGIDALFIDTKTFKRMARNKELAYWVKVSDYLVGSPWTEIYKANSLIINITLEGAKTISKKISVQGGKMLKIVLNAPLEQRKARILKREPGLNQQKLEYKLAHDPRKNIEKDYKKFDMVVGNPNGLLNKSVDKIYKAINQFLNQS